MESKVLHIAKNLFKDNLITKVELEKLKAEEKAYEEYYNYTMETLERKKEIDKEYLKLYKKKIEICKEFLERVNSVSEAKRKLLIETNKNQILEYIDEITEEFLQKYGNTLSEKIKKEIQLK